MSDNVLFLIMSTFVFVVFFLLWLNKVFENYYRKRYRKLLKHQGFIDVSHEDFSKTGISKVAVKLSSDYSSIYGSYHLSWDELSLLIAQWEPQGTVRIETEGVVSKKGKLKRINVKVICDLHKGGSVTVFACEGESFGYPVDSVKRSFVVCRNSQVAAGTASLGVPEGEYSWLSQSFRGDDAYIVLGLEVGSDE
jgi:hypothetical protein